MKRNIMIIMAFAMIAAFAFGVTASIEISTIHPTEDITVSEGQFTSVSAEVVCREVDCGDVETGLYYQSGGAFMTVLDGGNNDYGQSITYTSDGGYAITGDIRSYAGSDGDIALLKFSSNGTLEWSKIIDGSGSFDRGYSVIQTSDGGYAITGFTESHGGSDRDIILLKFSSDGTLNWSRIIDTENTDSGYSVVQTSDGGYAITGNTEFYGGIDKDIILLKFSSNGTLEWSRVLDGENTDYAYDIVHTFDGGYVVTGDTRSYGGSLNHIILLKFNASGTLEWSILMNGTGADYADSIINTSDGGYAVAGSTGSYGGSDRDIILLKFSLGGILEWSRVMNGSGSDYAYSIIQTSDGGYAITGWTGSYGGSDNDAILLKFSSDGTLEWSRILDKENDDRGYSLVQTTDGGYALTGFTKSYGGSDADLFLIKTDGDGNIPGFTEWMDAEAIVYDAQVNISNAHATVSDAQAIASDPQATASDAQATTTYIYEPVWGLQLVPTIPGSGVFYTNSTNPVTNYLLRDQTATVKYFVNATGQIGDNQNLMFLSNLSSNPNVKNQTEEFKLTIGEYIPLPVYVSFENDSDTTNFSEVTPNAVHYPVLANDYAKVEWIAANLNLAGLNLDEAVEYAHNRITVRSDLLPVLNTTANLTFRGVSYGSLDGFNVLKDGVLCEDCIKHSASPVVVEVTGFSNYTTQGTGEIPEFNAFTITIGLMIIAIGIIAVRKHQSK